MLLLEREVPKMKDYPFTALVFFIGASILGLIDGPQSPFGPINLSGLAFLWFGLGMIFLMNHYRRWALGLMETMIRSQLDAARGSRKRPVDDE